MRTQGQVTFRDHSHCPLINVRYSSSSRQDRHNALVLPDASVQSHLRAYLKIAHLGKYDDLTFHIHWIDLFQTGSWRALAKSKVSSRLVQIGHQPKRDKSVRQ